MRLFERSLRRAQLPVSMSKGFNPRPKLSFPLALQLGIEALDEIMELELDELIKPSDLMERLDGQLPDGIKLDSSEIIPLNHKSKIINVVYNVILGQSNMPGDLEINNLLISKILKVSRFKGTNEKVFDIRPSIINITRTETGLILHIKATNHGMARPNEILTALGIETKAPSDPIRIIRTHVNI